MATAFSLKDAAGNNYDFDLAGSVSQAGATVGNWTTNKDNTLAITLSAPGVAAVAPLPVQWNFNQNELCLSSAGNLVYNFNCVSGVAPDYSIVNATISIAPVSGSGFQFTLYPTWKLDDNHDLEVTIGDQTSTLTGILEDDKSRFVFAVITANPAHDETLFNLVFAGTWSSTTSAAGDPIMSFNYTVLDAAGAPTNSPQPFTLEQGVSLDSSINQFVYNYDKNGDTHSIQFVGELVIDEKFLITYSIKDQFSDGNPATGSSTIQIQTTFANDKFSENLQLSVSKPAGGIGATTLTVGGNFHWVFKGDGSLSMGFNYTYQGATGAMTVQFKGAFTLKNGDALQWDFEDSTVTNTMSISVSAVFSVDNVNGFVKTQVVGQNGQLQSIYVMAGISF